jgi:hypothetical protein
MLLHRLVSVVAIALAVAFAVPDLAHATKAEDKAMTKEVLNEAKVRYDAFETIAKAWKKAPQGTAEADALVQKGADALSALEGYVEEKLAVFESREAWYAQQGKDYKQGLDFMKGNIKKLKEYLNDARDSEFYQNLNP